MKRVNTIAPSDRHFDDFVVGQEFEVVSRGPMLVGDQVRWAGATDNYEHEFHHDEYVAKAQGLPGIILSGPLIASYMLVAVRYWVGRRGNLVRFSDRNSGHVMPRDSLHIAGAVRDKYVEREVGMLAIECRVEKAEGQLVCPGTALVAFRQRV